MRVLADTNVFIKFCRRLPLSAVIEKTLADPQTERLLSPVSVIELRQLWHTDTTLKKLKGFPQRYFANVAEPSGAKIGDRR